MNLYKKAYKDIFIPRDLELKSACSYYHDRKKIMGELIKARNILANEIYNLNTCDARESLCDINAALGAIITENETIIRGMKLLNKRKR